MTDTEFVGPVQHLFGFVCPGPVSFCGINTQVFCIAPVSVLDDGDVVGHMPALHPEVTAIQGFNKGTKYQTGVTSTTIPLFG